MALDTRHVAVSLSLSLGLAIHAGPSAGAGDIVDALRQSLEDVGWVAQPGPEGTVELRSKPVAHGEEEPPDGGDSAEPDAVPATTEPAEQLWVRLRESGWRVVATSDGSTLLFPPGSTEPEAPAAEPRVAESVPSPERDLGDHLAERGWRVERTADGSLLLYPQAPAAPVPSKATPDPCPGVLVIPPGRGDVSLPVDRWEEARVIADSWLASVDSPDSAIGRIRRIFRVYIVSIVGASPPHPLKHQIVIDAQDGRVIVLN